MRLGAVERRNCETEEVSELRRQSAREASSRRRYNAQSHSSEIAVTKQHEEGWCNPELELHCQPWVKEAMDHFHVKLNKWEHQLCTVCHELWPTRVPLKDGEMYVCTRCKRDKSEPNLYSEGNDMHPGEVPPCLQGMTQVEEMIIARTCPIMSVYRKHGGQHGYKGHVVNLPQDIQGFLNYLPCNVRDLPILIVRRHGAENTHTDFRVRRERVLFALQWLKANNPCYKDITIDHNALQHLPEDGIPPELLSVDEPEEQSCTQVDSTDDDNGHDSHSFLPLPTRQSTEDDAIRSAVASTDNDPLDWPEIAGQPINEFRTPYLATMSFPALFPYGTGDPTNPGRQRQVSLTDGFKHLIKYGEVAADNLMCWRFASHPRFPYWALNMKQRHQLLSQARIYIQHNPRDANLSIEELREMVGSFSADQLMKRLQRYAAKVQGSSQYWFSGTAGSPGAKGAPTFFWTVSSEDNYWPDLHRLMPHTTNDPTHSMRVQAVISNPHITDWYFTSRISDFVKHWLYDSLDADWHWYRLEYQARGSTHAHGCAKLKNDKGICTLVETAATGWLAQQEMESSAGREELLIAIEEGAKAKAAALKYANWLVTTSNDNVPDSTWSLPVPHPCAVKFQHIADVNTDYHDLVNSVQRHTRCSAAYCLRRKPGQQDQQCRFDYPRPLQERSTLEFERLDSGIIRATLRTHRNDPRVNSHNRVMLQCWRANVDLQVIVDVDACARYMAKYAAKGEPRSKSVQEIFKCSVASLRNDSDAHKAFRSAMLRAVGERDFSSQETCHMLLSLPLVSCSFTFTAISLYESHQLTKDKDSGELVLQPSILDQYATREGLSDINLCQFVSRYTLCRGKICEHTSPVIVRTFPRHSPNPDGEQYAQYCKCQLLKYKPWKNHSVNAWGGGTDTDETYIAAYHAFLQTEAGRLSVPHFTRDLAIAQRFVDQATDTDDEAADSPHDTQQEDWMLLCQHNQRFSMETESSSDGVDWAADARALPPDVLRESCTWVKSRRQETQDDPNSHWHRQLPPVDLSSLNVKQRQAYDTILHHQTQFMTGQQPAPLHMLVCGTAGTGKSFLISAIAQTLGSACLLTGTTGMASFNICGRALHSALQLPVRQSNNQDLQGAALQRLQLALKDVHYLVIDEMSMIGHRMLAWVDKRLRQGTGQLDQPLGGLSIILFGDFAQLPPVGDRPLYSQPTTSDLAIHGHSIYQMFTTVVILSQVLRQAGTDPAVQAFRDYLLRLRDGKVSYNDWQMLLQRTPQNADNAHEFGEAVRLFYTKDNVAKYNLEKLYSLSTPVARINAIHSSPVAASTNPDDANGLHPVIFLAAQARVMLTANLWQEVGLCNGAPGTVQQFLFHEGQAPPNLPIAVLVEFDNYTGPPFLADHPKCVPIPPMLAEWNSTGKHLSHQQLPLQLRYAMTIHKSQGQTLDKAVIDIGNAELAAGCTFVATSRLRRLQDGLFEPMSFERLQAIGKGTNLQTRIKEEARLCQLSEQTQLNNTH